MNEKTYPSDLTDEEWEWIKAGRCIIE